MSLSQLSIGRGNSQQTRIPPFHSLRVHVVLTLAGAVTVSQPEAGIRRKRIPEFDFWRGCALIVILIDHIPWNGLDYLTPQNFGFSDAAEVFVFLSGASVGLAYAPTLQKAGFRRLVERCAARAAKLYLVQIAMVACSIAIPVAAAAALGDQGLALGEGLSPFVNSPASSLLGAAVLAYQPNYSSVLALYVVLMLWAPFVIFLAWQASAFALLASIAVYVAGRRLTGGGGDGWTFNPLTWQLVFTIGVICALRWRGGLPRPRKHLILLVAAIILGAAILSVRAMGIKATAMAHLDVGKFDLGLVRLAHFLALAYIVSTVAIVEPWARRMSAILRSPLGQSFQGLGRNSLLFFAMGSVASAVGRVLMAGAHSLGAPHLFIHLIGLVYTVAAVIGMFAVVNRMHRTARPPRPSTENPNAIPASVGGSFASEADERAAFP